MRPADPIASAELSGTTKAMFYDIGRIPASTPEKPQAFRMNSGGAYAKHPSGAFVRLDKFRGSKKARLAARRKGQPGQ